MIYTHVLNLAVKVPPPLYEATVQFYRDVHGLKLIEEHVPAVGFEFGTHQLWIDRVPGLSQAEPWLELITNDISGASGHLLQSAGVVGSDELSRCQRGSMRCGCRASINIHLVCKDGESW